MRYLLLFAVLFGSPALASAKYKLQVSRVDAIKTEEDSDETYFKVNGGRQGGTVPDKN